MNAAIEKALLQLTNRASLNDVRLEELIRITVEHPYFAPAQLLLAAKLKDENTPQFQLQLQKTALYTSNPSWLEYELLNGYVKEMVPVQPGYVPTEEKLPEVVTPLIAEEKSKPLVALDVNNTQNSHLSALPAFEIPTVEAVRQMMENVEAKTSTVKEDEAPTVERYSVNTEQTFQAPASEFSVPSYRDAFRNIQSQPEPETDTDEEVSTAETDVQSEKLSSLLSSQLTDFNKPVDTAAKLDFEKEPYHTIDYFASQGIKIDLSKQPQDKLTQQLMRFTDWLKVMKKANPNPTDLGTDPELENAIQGIASASNEAKEIVTETMADIFMKQGKVDKAVQLYIKLSFLNPEKSSYFAAKIQQLKGM
ncbi:MAG: hypothetical protein KGO81_13130 [Bacteroidota bacterium]|nr:hypothetical protein [Bacteroidota bacterium]